METITEEARRRALEPWKDTDEGCRPVSLKPWVWQLRDGCFLPHKLYLVEMCRALDQSRHAGLITRN